MHYAVNRLYAARLSRTASLEPHHRDNRQLGFGMGAYHDVGTEHESEHKHEVL